MADQLKSFFSPSLVKRLASDLTRADPAFPAAAFVKDACAGLGALELLDRGRHISRALAAHLPPAYPDAIDVLLRSLGPEHATDELIGVGMAPFFYFPHLVFVSDRGLDHFDLSMRAQYELTKRFSAEASIRTFIASVRTDVCGLSRMDAVTGTPMFAGWSRKGRVSACRGRHAVRLARCESRAGPRAPRAS